ncbi:MULTISPECIES: bifunctional protein-disulfide isomerase/oxidoreductase DsbC [unclassified Alteromonas]|jgi:thiol:disulfide interchange protein DsbC|uniref:bifunctional protein-disulfide isomerase/oxidoreductase DsbC n=1 Tax=Alteromonas sp. CNT1-28 TaxID=2917730 RepID=UPI001EF36DE4|nr:MULTISPECIES: bifunctional protein-disulfide isomerase/oxidoreductase DsbC [unclassified Alteromonas]MCG7636801.1 bifunctional protein-disulfide isomerase/oxidoreductase DsbC [Alteromonas sp. CNT1-28]MCG7813198.1 bifunctional protein-disulfide isomerase/oxidoreductase DsbC [Alteromonas sp. MCA-1]
MERYRFKQLHVKPVSTRELKWQNGEYLVKAVKKVLLASVVAAGSLLGLSAQAADEAAIRDKLTSMLGLDVETIADSPVSGLVQVSTNRGLFYVSENGQYLLQARVFNIDEEMRNETELALSGLRKEGVKEMESSSITFKAKNEKHEISVFTDITCGYCRKFHNEIDELNDAGITVHYLAFPRSGLNSENYNDMVSVWCAKDPQKALTKAKAGNDVASASCKNKVAEQYMLGQKLGVNGTPNIVLPDGSLIPGYQPAALLAKALEEAE